MINDKSRLLRRIPGARRSGAGRGTGNEDSVKEEINLEREQNERNCAITPRLRNYRRAPRMKGNILIIGRTVIVISMIVTANNAGRGHRPRPRDTGGGEEAWFTVRDPITRERLGSPIRRRRDYFQGAGQVPRLNRVVCVSFGWITWHTRRAGVSRSCGGYRLIRCEEVSGKHRRKFVRLKLHFRENRL